MEKKIGIYSIKNKINDKKYIGSSKNIKRRWKDHKNKLNNKNHHNIYLERAWRKYSYKNFKFSIIVKVNKGYLLKAEQYWIDYYKTFKKENGYNILREVGVSPTLKGEEHPRWKPTKNIQCKYCGKTIVTKKYSQKYCSRSCSSKDKTGKNSANWKGGKVSIECKNCNKEYKVKRVKKDKSIYCSNECQIEGQKDRVELTCKNCNKNYKVRKSNKNSIYCSVGCKDEYESGENSCRSKLTTDEVEEIKIELNNNSKSHREIASEYNVSKSTITKISTGENWSHI